MRTHQTISWLRLFLVAATLLATGPLPGQAQPAIVSLLPNSGTGAAVTFQAVYSDPKGAGDLVQVLLQVSSFANGDGPDSCYVYYYPHKNEMFLRNDAGTEWLTPSLTPGVAGTLSNSQCTLNGESSSVNVAGNELTLNASLTFASTVVGPRNVFLVGVGIDEQYSGWVKAGTWTPNQSVGPPTVSWPAGSGSGDAVTFSAIYSDPNGATDLNETALLVNTSLQGAGACYVTYYPQGNQLYLRNDAGALPATALTPGVGGTASNSQCTLNAGSSSVDISGNKLTLNVSLSLTFASTVVGPRKVYLYASGFSGQNSGWVQESVWTPNPSAGPPAVVSLSPNAGGGPAVTFTAVYSDPNGAADLDLALFLINTSVNGGNANSCYVSYTPQNNQFHLTNDEGTSWLKPALTPGGAGTVSNSQCMVNGALSSVTMVGNNLTLNVSLTFTSTFAGARGVFLYTSALSGQNSTWIKKGTWAPNMSAAPASVTVISGTPQSTPVQLAFSNAFVVVVKDTHGDPLPGVTVTFEAPASGASGAFAGGLDTATTNDLGVASSAPFIANDIVGGPYTVTATVEGVVTPADFTLTNLTGASTGIFKLTGSMTVGRYSQTATLLTNGMVLIAGGVAGAEPETASAELYNPATGTFTPTGNMTTGRQEHTATLLNNGMVLVAGGQGQVPEGEVPLASAELYDPTTGTFTPTGSMGSPREGHTATLLNNGMVLMAGGAEFSSALATAELYDPATGVFSLTGSLNTARDGHTATLLDNGMVLVAGGFRVVDEYESVGSAELYDPAAGSFTVTCRMKTARAYSTATLLNDGKVLFAGGETGFGFLASAELFDPETGIFAFTGSLNTDRFAQTATLLNNGMVLVAGGESENAGFLDSAELYNPAAGSFAFTGSMNEKREYQTATLLKSGVVLMAGGYYPSYLVPSSAELFVPATLTPPNLVSITVTPASPTLSAGSTLQFIATGTFSDSSTQQLASATWSTSNAAVAQISNDAGNHGTALAVATGTVTIAATAGSVTGQPH